MVGEAWGARETSVDPGSSEVACSDRNTSQQLRKMSATGSGEQEAKRPSRCSSVFFSFPFNVSSLLRGAQSAPSLPCPLLPQFGLYRALGDVCVPSRLASAWHGAGVHQPLRSGWCLPLSSL